MKMFVFIITALFAIFIISCKTTGGESQPSVFPDSSKEDTAANAPLFSQVTGTEWKLIEVRVGSNLIKLDRMDLASGGFGDFFTLTFDSNMLSGRAAPNLYSAPFSLGSGQEINVSLARSTLMASIFQYENLREHDYYNYIQSAYKWNLVNSNLELSSRSENDGEIVMVFAR